MPRGMWRRVPTFEAAPDISPEFKRGGTRIKPGIYRIERYARFEVHANGWLASYTIKRR
ncbi:MAG: hypothetical protein HC882_00140 [Acidobacteria bacterium]|nr:hypothetical protein [Acidobacteriota bacterium]